MRRLHAAPLAAIAAAALFGALSSSSRAGATNDDAHTFRNRNAFLHQLVAQLRSLGIMH